METWEKVMNNCCEDCKEKVKEKMSKSSKLDYMFPRRMKKFSNELIKLLCPECYTNTVKIVRSDKQ